jgi:2-polyprenyl-3-methyl-5-hydroxy-6-metoxy-1,4-benzoquinol methylase
MNEYHYSDGNPTHANAYLWPVLRNVINARAWPQRRAFDLGCGNGATCNMLSTLGFDVTGVDTSKSGIVNAQRAHPHVKTCIGSAYDDLAGQYGTFPLVVSLEVIEHCIDAQSFAKSFLSLIAPDGVPSEMWLEFGGAISGDMKVSFQAARSIG